MLEFICGLSVGAIGGFVLASGLSAKAVAGELAELRQRSSEAINSKWDDVDIRLHIIKRGFEGYLTATENGVGEEYLSGYADALQPIIDDVNETFAEDSAEQEEEDQ